VGVLTSKLYPETPVGRPLCFSVNFQRGTCGNVGQLPLKMTDLQRTRVLRSAQDDTVERSGLPKGGWPTRQAIFL
jgi:hypothetical protein